MSAHNIEMIASSLRNCSITSRRRRSPAPPPSHPSPNNGEITVELNSDAPLPYHWEQCLDMRTGALYYINWKDGRRTTEDPRIPMAPSSEDDESSDEDISYEDDEDDDEDSGDPSCSSGVTSVSSLSSNGATSRGVAEALVAAGCKGCFMYFMVPKSDEGCPRCGGALLHLGRRSGGF